MNIQSAGNQRVNAYTLVGSSETECQLPDNEDCTFLNLFAIKNFHMQKINHRCFFIIDDNSGSEARKNKRIKQIFFFSANLVNKARHLNRSGWYSSNRRFYCTYNHHNLNPNFVTGFTDGEGSFIIRVIKS